MKFFPYTCTVYSMFIYLRHTLTLTVLWLVFDALLDDSTLSIGKDDTAANEGDTSV